MTLPEITRQASTVLHRAFFQQISFYPICLITGFRPIRKFSLIMRRHHCWWRTENFDICSALMAIDQWGFFSVQHLLWHGASVYNGHLRGPVTLMHTCCWAFASGAITTRFYDLHVGLSRLVFEQPTFRLRDERYNPLCHRRGFPICSKPWWWIDVHQNNKTNMTSRHYNHKSIT